MGGVCHHIAGTKTGSWLRPLHSFAKPCCSRRGSSRVRLKLSRRSHRSEVRVTVPNLRQSHQPSVVEVRISPAVRPHLDSPHVPQRAVTRRRPSTTFSTLTEIRMDGPGDESLMSAPAPSSSTVRRNRVRLCRSAIAPHIDGKPPRIPPVFRSRTNASVAVMMAPAFPNVNTRDKRQTPFHELSCKR